jgi:site-specific recombinase XerD
LIYHRTKHLREAQLLLGHTTLDSTSRYLGVEVEDAWKLRSIWRADETAMGREQ